MSNGKALAELLTGKDPVTEEEASRLWALVGIAAGGEALILKEAFAASKAAEALRATEVLAKTTKPKIIREIVSLPNNAILTAEQVVELERNLDRVLLKSLPSKVATGRADEVINLINTDKRFRFLDQIPGATKKIREAFLKHGLTYGGK